MDVFIAPGGEGQSSNNYGNCGLCFRGHVRWSTSRSRPSSRWSAVPNCRNQSWKAPGSVGVIVAMDVRAFEVGRGLSSAEIKGRSGGRRGFPE